VQNMDEISKIDTAVVTQKPKENDNLRYSDLSISKKSILPTVIGFLLIIAGTVSLINWSFVFFLDINNLNTYYDISQLQQIYPNITYEQFLNFLKTCATIGLIVSVFPILGGILAIKRKMWGISITCSIIGLLSIGIYFTSSLFSFIGIIVLFISKKEFQ